MMKSILKTAGLSVLALGLSAQGMALALNGAGSTFIYPLLSKWSYEYNNKVGVQINYQSIGSGGGIQQLTNKTVDFACSDAYMTDEMIQKTGADVIQLPATMGAVVVAFNVPGVDTGLKLDANTLVSMYMGLVTKWNDPAIKALNPDVNLPDLAITIAHRSDGSGTTNIFTDYLTRVSTKWAAAVGKGTAVKWPAGVGGKGNEAVAGLIRQIPGCVGYVELAYVLQNKLTYAFLKNREGNFVEPSMDSVSAAAAGALKRMPADFRVSFTNAPGEKSYPICGFTWFLVYSKMSDAAKAKALVDFLNWAEEDGQKMSSALYYSPLPDELVAKVKEKIATIGQ